MTRVVSASALALLAVLVLAASAALAAKPTFTRIDFVESGTDELLTEACGFPVMFTEQGQVTIRDFELADKGLARVLTVNAVRTASANGNEVTFRDVGADHVRVAPDGTVIASVIGQLPLDFTGVLKFNPETGETTLEPQHNLEGQVAAVCEALSA
jgi:hypothetical protein